MRSAATLARFTVVVAGLSLSALVAEGVFRVLERRDQGGQTGDGCWIVPDVRWGWKLRQGRCQVTTPEFTVDSSTNVLSMNDDPYAPAAEAGTTRILALGDSHTQAIGVNTADAWPKVLQRSLTKEFPGAPFRVYNAGTAGYSLHQYLLRLMDQGPLLKPHYVVVGFGLPSDLYDLLPPDHGGWAFFETLERDYFDFDTSGALVQRHWIPPDARAAGTPPSAITAARRVRRVMEWFGTFRYLRRTNLALTLGATLRIGDQTLWPNMEVVVERDVSPMHEYNWRLAYALLDRIHQETVRLNAQLVVLLIPYLPQVYDETWRSTFGRSSRYSRTAANERILAWLQSRGIPGVDATPAMRTVAARLGRWLHYPKDAHPTPEGHVVLAEELAAAGALRPRPAP